jgi:cytochrome b pre-mRNA-processing protein 3
LWHRVVEISRHPAFYREDGVADTVPGRFDMIAAILALIMLRMERDDSLAREQALLTELFVADMDAQLRQSGIGDMVIGKRVGKLVSVLGGRLGALREALAGGDDTALADALGRNVTMAEGRDTSRLAARLRTLEAKLSAMENEELLAGHIQW